MCRVRGRAALLRRCPTRSGLPSSPPNLPTMGCRAPAGSAICVHDSSLNCFADGNQNQSGLLFLLYLFMHPA